LEALEPVAEEAGGILREPGSPPAGVEAVGVGVEAGTPLRSVVGVASLREDVEEDAELG
jgi:hypothetical protein